ncbi:hypothetical protein F2Q68_00020646 [Brassica cretica]|uniref:WAT1-related protein n=1 Tax=Brassica cretica TaxID=69181 RepID=A0A8S9FWB7_BRACR|nr:hypothetical protein F2Q68_00020646 [Brassica cretica]
MNMTSATYTSAIMNVLPSVTFIIAWILRMEKVNIAEVRSQAKIIGTLVALGGALVMTLYKGPLIPLPWSNPNTNQHNGHSNSSQDHNHWVGGTLLILLGCVAWSCFYVLQIAFEGLARMHGLVSYRCSEELDRCVATELWLEPGRYVATERDERSVAT